jgi:two-component system, OmpR family, sensor kinase
MNVLRHRPLRVKLSLLIVVLLALGLFVSSLIATTALRGYLVDRVDEQLVEASRPFASFPDRILPIGTPSQGESRPRPPSRFYVEVVTASGATVIETPTTDAPSVPALPDSSTIGSLAGMPVTVASVDGDAEWRVLVTPLSAESGWAVIAYPLGDVRATVGRLVLLQAVVGIAVTVIAGVAGFVVVRRSLRPLDDMAATAHEIADGDLSRRVPETASSSEVKQLAESFNTMVTRIERSFAAQQASEAQARQSEERMRRFVADAGHELRTPLTSIRGYAELIEQGAAPDPAEAVARIQVEAQRMGGLVDDLQLLARLDEQRPMDTGPVDLASIAADAVNAARVADADRELRLTVEGSPPLVSGDAPRLRQVLDNLLSNAVRYSTAGSDVLVRIEPVDTPAGAVRVSVTDHGQGLSEEDASRVFDRLYRTDEARSRVHGGSGLGLAIVQSIIDAHGGDVFVDSEVGRGSTFGFTLPPRA